MRLFGSGIAPAPFQNPVLKSIIPQRIKCPFISIPSVSDYYLLLSIVIKVIRFVKYCKEYKKTAAENEKSGPQKRKNVVK
jgi:hypothetical protein